MTDPAGVSRTTIAEEALRSALSSGERPKRPNALSASLTFGWRALLKIKHVPEQLFDAVGNPIIFTLLFTYLLGGAIAGSTGAYLQFLIPGILVQTVILITAYTGFNLNTDISKGVSDRFRSLPIWRPSVIVGALLGDVARYALASAIVLALGLVLGFRPEGVVGVLLSVALLAKTMPGWLETAVGYNPITHLVSAIRGLMSGTMPAGHISWLLVGCAMLVAVFAPITVRLYRNKE